MTDSKFAILVGAAVFAVFMVLLFDTGMSDRKTSQLRFEQCIAAGMQWSNGDCLK